MPCKDSSAVITILLDPDDRLQDFQFSKITCQKEIGDYEPYNRQCRGKSIQEILEFDFSEAADKAGAHTSEDQFLLYLQWEALRSALLQYLGEPEPVDTERYLLDSVTHGEEGVEIRQVIRPPSEMPKIIPCSARRDS